MLARTLLLTLMAVGVFASIHHAELHPRKILLNEVIDTTHHRQFHEESLFSGVEPSDADTAKHQFLLQLNPPITHELKTSVQEAIGLKELDSYLPHNAFLVYMTHAQAVKAQKTEGVAWVGHHRAEHKHHLTLLEQGRHLMEASGAFGDSAMNVHTVEEMDDMDGKVAGWVDQLEAMGISVKSHTVQWKNQFEIEFHHDTDMHSAKDFLAEQREISYLERRPVYSLQNKYSRSICQDGTEGNIDPKDTLASKFGLTGAGQIVGVSDSGLDWRSCFFYDPANPNGPPFKTCNPCTGTTPTPTPNMHNPRDLNHRKVVQYVNWIGRTDQVDDQGGHGTHVSGSVAGSTHQDVAHKAFNGQAPNAKLAFWDIGDAQGRLRIPAPYNIHLIPYQYATGARIHSNSWGANVPFYDGGASQFDKFQFDNPDMLILVAAGNSGDQGSGSVGTPATAKNIMSVGASTNSVERFADTSVPSNIRRFIRPPSTKDYHLSVAYFSSLGPAGPDRDNRIAPNIVAPGASVISANVGQNPGASCGAAPATVLKDMAGTSMATPVLAGTAALVREYFVEGYWPSGAKGGSTGFNPSAALVKAVLLGGATKQTGVHGARPLAGDSLPNNFQGFGRVNLKTSLHFAGQKNNLLILADNQANPPAVNTNEPLVATNEEKTIQFCVNSQIPGAPAKVTLVWTDKEGAPNAQLSLVNNLDLTVQGPNGTPELKGNNAQNGDRVNSQEQVILPTTPAGPTQYVAKVRGALVTVGKIGGRQPFALVVTGDVKEGTCAAPEPPETYVWQVGEYGPCSASCDGGIQTRTVQCVGSRSGVVEDAKCDQTTTPPGPKPATQQACNTQKCAITEFEWVPSAWDPCSCPPNTQIRAVVCKTIDPAGAGVVVDDAQCKDHAKPITVQQCECPSNDPVYEWQPKDKQADVWTACSKSCDSGTQTRELVCVMLPEVVVPDGNCTAAGKPKPPTQRPCNTCACPGPCTGNDYSNYQWVVQEWGPCSVGCGGGKQERTVECKPTAGGPTEDDSMCDPAQKPARENECSKDACEPDTDYNWEWQVGQWGDCKGGTHSRWVICRKTTGQYGEDRKCEAHVGNMPVKTESCTDTTPVVDEKNPKWAFFANRWGDPDIWCGNGQAIKKRTLACTAPGGLVADTIAKCGANKPMTELRVDVQPCPQGASWQAGVWMGCTKNEDPCSASEHRHTFCVGPDGKKTERDECNPNEDMTRVRNPCGCCDKKCMYVPGMFGGVYNSKSDVDEDVEVSYDRAPPGPGGNTGGGGGNTGGGGRFQGSDSDDSDSLVSGSEVTMPLLSVFLFPIAILGFHF